jgi:phosphatidylinositol alpha-1,6-mannosyltransferase
VPSLLVTNDFPPKMGGIQSYLHELWRRLPPDETTVLTTPYEGAVVWDATQPFRVERTGERVLLPKSGLAARIDSLARELGADVVFLDPMLPLGLVGPRLRAAPFVVVAHGAEVMVPGRLPGTRHLARRVLRASSGVVAAGTYPARIATRVAGPPLPVINVPPGVDTDRFRPLPPEERASARTRFGLPVDRPVVVGLSRLVPRKGFDVLIDAVAGLDVDVQLAIAGSGRDAARLESRAARRGIAGRTRFLGRVPDADVADLYACADVFAMLCRERWAGLEAEGFGIVFVEAAACGVPVVAGRSGGAHEAVVDGETGLVVTPRDVGVVRAALERLLRDDALRTRFGAAARRRAVDELSYDRLAARLLPVTRGDLGMLAPLGEA